MRVLAIIARYGTDKYADAPEQLRELFARQMPGVSCEIMVADNAQPPEWTETGPDGTILIGGDNTSWEFSAWDRALQHLGRSVRNWDLICLVTSAFRQEHSNYLDRVSEPLLHCIAGRARALGHIDYGNAPVTLRGVSSQCWIRSSFLLTPPRELELLGRIADITDGAEFFSGDPLSPFRDDAPISDQYKRNIVSWLCGQGLGQGTTWHSRFDLTAETMPFFQNKARAILNEQRLSSRLMAQGTQLVDVTWLWSRLAAGGAPACIPPWRSQVTARSVDAAPVSILQY
ncbi:hypothetical protein [Roseococcus sp. YIM B11640]|uniref:hypothetical protein n=1 Tax=Roseococcus sp. YIM B11640 TaxID=3133973 RepID=UPI003C7E6468